MVNKILPCEGMFLRIENKKNNDWQREDERKEDISSTNIKDKPRHKNRGLYLIGQLAQVVITQILPVL
jgi:hypothetical protein